MTFVDLEKACDREPRRYCGGLFVLLVYRNGQLKQCKPCMQVSKVGHVEKVLLVKNLKTRLGCTRDQYPLLFIKAAEALSREFSVGCPWEMLYTDDLVIFDETCESLLTKMAVWKNCLESKGLKVNMGKTKVMISCRNLHTMHTSGKYPCAVCWEGVGKNLIFCNGCSFWVHKCSNIPGRLVEDPDFRCRRCLGNADNRWKTLS